jgi:hypothetical protein
MQTQHFIEKADGERFAISEDQANIVMLSGQFFRVISTAFMCVYRMKNVKHPVMPSYKYGGRNNPRSPVNYRGA